MTISTQSNPTRSIPTNGSFNLRELATFGFGYQDAAAYDGTMRMAMCVDGTYEQHAAVQIRQRDDVLDIEVLGDADPDVVAAQTARILSVEHDDREFIELGRRDPMIGRLQEVAPGLRPPQFCSPYEAAIWSVISTRRGRNQSVAVRERLNARYGRVFEVDVHRLSASPTPSQLAQLPKVDGLTPDRLTRLHAIGRAALDGRLAVDRLRSLDPDEAMAGLQELPGIGPFYSSLIVIRALGHTDVLPLSEPLSRRAVHQLYGIGMPMSDAQYVEFAKQWAPMRTWAVVLIRAASGRLANARAA